MARDLSLSSPDYLTRTAPWGDRAAWTAWAALFATISILILAGSDHSVVSAYRDATRQWFAGGDIYTDTGHGFLYLPIAAILFAPFAWLPTAASEIGWRFVAIGGFAVGVYRLCRLAAGGRSDTKFALLTLASLPPALACARNGQSTLVMSGLMMLACVDLAEERRGWAALWATLAVALKPLAIVLLSLAHPGSPAGVADGRWTGRHPLRAVSGRSSRLRDGSVLEVHADVPRLVLCGIIELWAQPFCVLGLLGIKLSESTQTVIRVVAAGGAIGLCLVARYRSSPPEPRNICWRSLRFTSCCFNPRTENNTYAMLGPAIGLPLLAALAANRPSRAEVAFLSVLLALMAIRGRAGSASRRRRRAHLVDPLAGRPLFALSDPSPVFPRAGPGAARSGNQPIRRGTTSCTVRMRQ